MSVSVISMRIMPGGDEWIKNCILKLAVVRILFPKPHMLLLSFIININYPVGEERDNIHHQASGFGNTLLGTQHVKWKLCTSLSAGLRQSCIQRKKPLCNFI